VWGAQPRPTRPFCVRCIVSTPQKMAYRHPGAPHTHMTFGPRLGRSQDSLLLGDKKMRCLLAWKHSWIWYGSWSVAPSHCWVACVGKERVTPCSFKDTRHKFPNRPHSFLSVSLSPLSPPFVTLNVDSCTTADESTASPRRGRAGPGAKRKATPTTSVIGTCTATTTSRRTQPRGGHLE
jgi:hypothetical protein